MADDKREIQAKVSESLRLLSNHDAFLLESNVHERTSAARLACYLAPLFPEYSVDVEYNRHGIRPKRVNLAAYQGGENDLIFPDVIVHERNNDEKNLLVIQVKKETNPEPRDRDRAVIRAMMEDFKYTYGLLIDLPAGKGAAEREPKLEWHQKG